LGGEKRKKGLGPSGKGLFRKGRNARFFLNGRGGGKRHATHTGVGLLELEKNTCVHKKRRGKRIKVNGRASSRFKIPFKLKTQSSKSHRHQEEVPGI